jgi:hypothetical protein
MDAVLADKVNAFLPEVGEGSKATDVSIVPVDFETIEIASGENIETYHLKPLAELFGVGTGHSVDPQDDLFLPLMLGIEEEIVRYDTHKTDHYLTDASVALALDQLAMDPAGASADPLARQIQFGLRLTLSLNDYSRQEVRQAIRKIAKSVNRHKNGDRGYLMFVRQFFGSKQ